MPTKISDWKCNSCNHVWEFLSHKEDQHPNACPVCSSNQIEVVVSGGSITKCHDPDVLKETLQKRSADHTRELVKKQAGHRGTLPPDFGRHRQ